MKVVLFCGGLGTRLREHSDTIPKPLVNVGVRPIIWHLMRYYAHFGHKDFMLCLGYRGDLIREYFLNYNECLSNDFTLSEGGRRIELHSTDIQDWRITFVDTGLHSNIAQRLVKVRKHLEGEAVFLANYADGLSDVPLDRMIADFESKKAVASFAGVNGWHSFHTVEATSDGWATHIDAPSQRRIPDQRRLLRAATGDLRLHRGWRRTRRAAVHAPDRQATWRSSGTRDSGARWTRSRTRSRWTAWKHRGDCPWMVWKP